MQISIISVESFFVYRFCFTSIVT